MPREDARSRVAAYLYEKCFGRLVRWFQKNGLSRADAEELLQEGISRVDEIVRSGQEVCNPPALLSTILRNLQIDESRRDKPEKYMDDYSTALGIASNQAGPEDVVAREQVLKRISDVIERARGRLTRDIFFDIRIYKLSYKEIAQKNRVTPRAVERHVARAMEVLRECEELAELLK